MSEAATSFQPGNIVQARGREWVVLPGSRDDVLQLRPLGGSEEDSTFIYVPLEPQPPVPASFPLPDPDRPGSQEAALLLRDAMRLKLRAGAGPFRSFGNIAVEPRAYQLVPLLMALKLDPVRLLIADDVGIGKTVEAGLVAREMLDRGEIGRTAVICPPHLCEQWHHELTTKFNIPAEVVRPGTAARLERGLRPDESVFDVYDHTVVSLDYIKSDRRRDDFLRACPEFVMVDEAHTCVRANTNTRHQRYQLLKGLAEGGDRHMVLLTATPHSGDDEAFHNLLGLIKPDFRTLMDLSEGEEREALRRRLADHFAQRRRGDIKEWKDSAGLPTREAAEATYRLTGDWGRLFDEVLDYAKGLVDRAEGGSKLQQRMSWWAALALLRCVSSSPAAASMALRTRLEAAEGVPEERQVEELDDTAAETVFDGLSDDTLTQDESVPAGTTESPEDAGALRQLIDRAERLHGPKNDPKLATLIREVEKLLADGFKPVVFCRYIPTAHYVGEHLRAALRRRSAAVEVVTGELTSDQRADRVEALHDLEEGTTPVLVATDCLSEGINLQRLFDAAVHYDLTWNPTRHEQREGRVDRFGQGSDVVRTLMLYGEDNPVDGAVLKVIVRKAEKIRKELGVAIPMPSDSNKVVEAIMRTVLLRSGGVAASTRQMSLDFGETEREVDTEWERAKEKASRTVFAQRRMKPDEVLPEWRKAVEVLGGEEDVQRFVTAAAQRLDAPLQKRSGHWRFPTDFLPAELQDRLAAVGCTRPRLAFRHPAPSGCEYVHRSHPLVNLLADYVAERALDEGDPALGARCNATYTQAVQTRTTVFLLRLRSHLGVEARDGNGGYRLLKTLLSEECVGLAVRGSAAPEVLGQDDALALIQAESVRNMDPAQKARVLDGALQQADRLQPEFERLARERADELLADHRRVRTASDAKGLRYSVSPSLPVDVIGVYVLVPAATL